MLPVLILVGIPSATAACYLSWCQGQNLAMRLSDNRLEPPTQSILSYTLGLTALLGSYALQAQAIRRLESGDNMPKTTTSSSTKGAYNPPSGIGDVMGRAGKPALLHIGAASFAFFCMGIAQNYVACARDPIATNTTTKKERR
jgi:hypothetical protein